MKTTAASDASPKPHACYHGHDDITDKTVDPLQLLLTNPLAFVNKYTLSVHNMTDSPVLSVRDSGFARLIEQSNKVFEVRFVFGHGEPVGQRLPAYFLGYNAGAQSSNTPAWVDIPIKESRGALMFTGTLTGCTVIVTQLNEQTYRVFHDSRLNSAGLYDNVVMATNYMDYQFADNEVGIAAAFMHHDGTTWRLITQRQQLGQSGSHNTLPELKRDAKGNASIEVMTPEADYGDKFRARFDAARKAAHRELNDLARSIKLPSNTLEDGPYTPGSGFRTEADAFAAWTSRVSQVKGAMNETIKRMEIERQQLVKTSGENSTTRQMQVAIDQLREKLARVTGSIMDVERIWLWRRIRDVDGPQAVVDLNGPRQPLNENDLTIGERYAYRHDELAQDDVFKRGKAEFEKVKLSDAIRRMSLSEKKLEFLKMALDKRELGALSALIAQTEAKTIAVSLERAAALSEALSQPGVKFKQLMPQNFFLGSVKDEAPGRCYPLVRAMAVALAQRGNAGAQQLIGKMFFAAASPDQEDTKLLRQALMQLHGDRGARQASVKPKRLDIGRIANALRGVTSTRVFALNTAAHAMLVACVVESHLPTFYFYDPNVGVFGYSSVEHLEQALRAHLVTNALAKVYEAFGAPQDPNFDLVEIKADLMAQVQLNNGLSVEDLSSERELTEVAAQYHASDNVDRRLSTVSADLRLQSALTVTEGRRLGDRFYDAMHTLKEHAGLIGRWMPIIDTIRKTDAHTNQIQFIDPKDPHAERWLESKDEIVAEFKAFLEEHSGEIGRRFTVDHDRIVASNDTHADVESVDGLNAGFAIQTLIDWFGERERHDTEQGKTPPALAVALTVHSYLNLVQISHGTIEDAIKVTGIVRALMQEQPVANGMALGAFSKAFGHAFGALGMATGVMSVGLDIFELTQAENAAQKGVFGTQLAFDSASLVTGVGGAVAGMVGASTAGAMLGGAGAILGGLAVGFTGLARVLGDVAEEVLEVGRYFATVQTAYRSGGYAQAVQNGTPILTPLPGAVVSRIDMPGKRIAFDTQYIYRTKHGSTGSGKDNYFFWAGDFPMVVHDRNQAIDIRSGIGCDAASDFNYPKARALLLPATPKSYITYSYGPFPGVTTRHDEGLDVVRKLEQDYRFDFDFYIFPGEQAVNRLHQEFVDTPVDIDLDDRDMTLVTPILPKASQGFLHYRIVGAGARYTIVLNEGSRVTLSGKPAGKKSSFFISTDAIQTASQVQVHADRIDCGAVSVLVNRQAIESVHIVTATRAVLRIDFDKQQALIVSENASGWVDTNVSFKEHLAQQAKDNRVIARITTIEDYQLGGKNLGRAYYDADTDRILYTNSDWPVIRKGQLIGVSRDAAYFVNDAKTTIWCSDIETGAVLRWFAPWFSRGPNDLHRLWQEQDGIYIQCQFDWMWKGLLTYRINPETHVMTLISAAGDDALLRQLARTATLGAPVNITALLQTYGEKKGHWLIGSGGELVTPIAADMVMLSGHDNEGVAHRYWLRTRTGVLIKPNLGAPLRDASAGGQTLVAGPNGSTKFVEVPSHASQASLGQSGIHSADPIPDDLTLVGWRAQGLAAEYFYFYSQRLKTLFGQSGPGQAELDATHPTAVALDTGPLAGVVGDGGAIVILRQDGQVLEIADDQSYHMVAVNEHWLAAQTCWWRGISQEFDKRAVFAIFGLTHGPSSKSLPAWFCKGNVIVASAALRDQVVQLLDVENGQARVFCPATKTVYLQAGIAQEDLARAFGNGTFLQVDTVPAARPVDLGVPVGQVQVVSTGLRLTTPQGLIYLRSTQGALRLVGASSAWWHAQANPAAALAEQAARTPANGVVTVYTGQAKAWFDLERSRLYEGAMLSSDAAHDAEFLGTSIDGQKGYVYSRSQLTVYGLDYPPDRYKMGDVRRIDTSLAAQPADGVDIMPILHNQNTLVLAGAAQDRRWDLQKCWHTGGTVVICADDAGRVTLRVFDDLEPYLMCSYRGDLWVFDPETWSTLIVRRAFAAENPPRVTLQGVFGRTFDKTIDRMVSDYRSRGSGRAVLMSLGE